MDLGATYRESRVRMAELAVGLDAEELSLIVPACPAWTVKDLVAHVTGVAVDAVSGRLTGVASDEWTDVQVSERSTTPLHEILDEWSGAAEVFEAVLSANPKFGTPVIDLWTHEQDLRGALGLGGLREGPGLHLSLKSASSIKAKLLAAGLPGLRVIAGDDDRVIGTEPPGATLRIEPYEWARAVMGRRSMSQLRSYDWEGDPEAYLPHLSVFPPPDRDLAD